MRPIESGIYELQHRGDVRNSTATTATTTTTTTTSTFVPPVLQHEDSAFKLKSKRKDPKYISATWLEDMEYGQPVRGDKSKKLIMVCILVCVFLLVIVGVAAAFIVGVTDPEKK